MEEFLFDDNLDGNYIIILENGDNDFEFTLENSLKLDKVDEPNLVNVVVEGLNKSLLQNHIYELEAVEEAPQPVEPVPALPAPVVVRSEEEIKQIIDGIYDKFHLNKTAIKVSQPKKENDLKEADPRPELTCYLKSKGKKLKNTKIASLTDILAKIKKDKDDDGPFVVLVEDQSYKFTKITTSDKVRQGIKTEPVNPVNRIIEKLSDNDVIVKPVTTDPVVTAELMISAEPVMASEDIILQYIVEPLPLQGVMLRTDDGREFLLESVSDQLPKSDNIILKKAEQIDLKEDFRFEARVYCDRCNYSTRNLEDLRDHKVDHPPRKIFKCDNCPFKTTDLRELYRHMDESNCKKIFSCDQCDYTTPKPNELYQHKKIHPKKKKHTCLICLKTFTNSTELTEHKKEVHIRDDVYKCEHCDFKSLTVQPMRSHRTTHSNEKPYMCNECGKSFRRFDVMKVHTKTHSSEKPFACDLCDYRTRFPTNLKGHRRTHFDEKPFSCEMCTYRTKNLNNLRNHKKTHLTEKEFGCDQCKYRTHSSSHLKNHKRIHSGEMSFKCDVCEFKCKHPNGLINHKRRCHKAKMIKIDALQAATMDILDLGFIGQDAFVNDQLVDGNFIITACPE